MAKTKRSILMLLACVFRFSVAALIFTACSTPSYTVTFLVQNDTTGEWEQYATETSEEGVVTLPNNPSKTDYVFRNWHPQVVFHAAAYKHVPLMEENPCEAVRTNVFGTRVIADAAVS